MTVALIRRLVAWLRNPPDLIERSPTVQFVIAVFPDYSVGITATKLTGPKPEVITAITQVTMDALFQWARSNGVQMQVKSAPPSGPAKNPLRGVRP